MKSKTITLGVCIMCCLISACQKDVHAPVQKEVGGEENSFDLCDGLHKRSEDSCLLWFNKTMSRFTVFGEETAMDSIPDYIKAQDCIKDVVFSTTFKPQYEVYVQETVFNNSLMKSDTVSILYTWSETDAGYYATRFIFY